MNRQSICATALCRWHLTAIQLAALCLALSLESSVEAGVFATASPSRNPPSVPFTIDLDYNSAPLSNVWESYVIGVATNDGSKIIGIDMTVTGPLNQRWNVDPTDDPPLVTPTPSSTNITTADSHLILPASSPTLSSPMENNNQPSALPTAADTDTRDYGVGTILEGAWAYVAAEQSTSVDVAYLVFPRHMGNQVYLDIEYATQPDQGGNPIVSIQGDLCSLFGVGCPLPTPPTVNDALIDGVTAGDPANNPVLHTFTAMTHPKDIPVWSDFSFNSYTLAFGGMGSGPAIEATFNPANQLFSWDTTGSPRGIYTWNVKVTDFTGSDVGALTVNVTGVPEPINAMLAGMALTALAGLRRRN